MPPSNLGPTAPIVRRARIGALALFCANGLMLGSYLARYPSLREQLGDGTAVSAETWGVLLLVGALGQFAVYPAMGHLVARLGTRTVLLGSTALAGAGIALIATSALLRMPPLFAVGAAVLGACWGTGGVPANLEAAAVERRLGRTVMPQFHGAYSVGAAAGAGLGAACAAAGVPVAAQLVASGAGFVLIRLATLRTMLPETCLPAPAAPRATGEGPAPRGPWRERATLLIGAIFCVAFFAEGAANDWLTSAIVQGFSVPESRGGSVLAIFLGAMTTLRLAGSPLIDRFGRVRVLRASNVVCLAGVLLFSLAPTMAIACVGVALWGAGAGLVGPIAIAAASDDPTRAAGRVAVISSMGSGFGLLSPLLLGTMASHFSIRGALIAVALAAAVSMALAAVVAPARARGNRVRTMAHAKRRAGQPRLDGIKVPSNDLYAYRGTNPLGELDIAAVRGGSR